MSTVRTSPRDYWRLLAQYLKPQRGRVALLALLLLTSTGLQLASPLVVREFIDRALADDALNALLIVAAIYIGIALLVQVIGLGETWTAENVGWTATNELRAELARHVLGLDMGFHNQHTPGNLIERVDGDVFALGNFFSRFVINLAGNLLLTIGVVALLLRIDWRIGVAVAIFAAITFAALVILGNTNSVRHAAARQAGADLMGFLEERIGGTEDIRSSGATEYVMRRNHEYARGFYRKKKPAVIVGGLTFAITQLLSVLGMVAALAIAGTLYQDGQISLGSVFVVFQFTTIMVAPLEEISRQFRDFQQASASIARVRQLQAIAPKVTDGEGIPIPPGSLGVEFDDVTFGYVTSEPTVKQLSLTIAPQRVLGVVGRTGSGKTTLTRLLVRFYDPDRGAIRVGGVDLRDTAAGDLRQRIALVTQDIQLFRATVRDNLTLFDATIPDQRITDALERLGLGDWLASLESGLDTMLASGGGGISAGEAQLLAFTRVFLRDPDVVILDEASSRLDPSTEARLERAIDTLLSGRTAVVIAHRLATLQRADEILVMANGEMVEHGEREALAADPASIFAGLLRSSHHVTSQEATR
ncbi:MAG TPA: ABC transporter ATP-binding protein [Thermomicrobiales bacterium]|nr:ABC transporter ATP-binding protein [Thermomicrobiales bacterium]